LFFFFLNIFKSDLARLVEIDKAVAVFIMATYGEGDPTDNAQELYDFLQQGQLDLNGLKYGVMLYLLIYYRKNENE
jgi:sulfite reductase alpha subunit-like flavoprotein